MTKFVKKDEINCSWFEIDATGAVVGRLATVVSKIIRGKNKTTFTPHMDDGDFVVVKNADQIKFTGNKFQNKKYYRHSGYPGGIKETTPERLHAYKPEEVLKLAVKRMRSRWARITSTGERAFVRIFAASSVAAAQQIS